MLCHESMFKKMSKLVLESLVDITHFVKQMSIFWNLVTIFGILMKNAFKRAQTCLVTLLKGN